MPAAGIGRWIRHYRLTYWSRIADWLQAEADKLDHDPLVTLDGDYLCWDGKRVYCRPAAELVRKYGTQIPPALEGRRTGAGQEG